MDDSWGLWRGPRTLVGVLLLAGFVGSLAGGVLGPVLLGVLAFSGSPSFCRA